MNQLNEWFSDKISDLPPPADSFIFKVSFQLAYLNNLNQTIVLYSKLYI